MSDPDGREDGPIADDHHDDGGDDRHRDGAGDRPRAGRHSADRHGAARRGAKRRADRRGADRRGGDRQAADGRGSRAPVPPPGEPELTDSGEIDLGDASAAAETAETAEAAGANGHAPAGHGRAGRDLRAATIVGLSLLVLIFASLFLWMPAFVGIVVVAVVLAVSELSQALNTRGVAVPVVPVLIGAVLMCVGAYVGGVGPLVATFGLTVVAVGVWRLGDPAAGYLRDVTAGVFTTVYVPLLAGFVLLLAASDNGAWAVIALLAVVVASDTGGYFAGVLLGRHPMAPTVSPKKSWEGFAGSLVFGSAVGIAVMVLGFDGTWWTGLILGVVGVAGATVGDLGESLLKRDLGIKDMSDLLPGHGGLMDRVDSILPTAPLIWLVLTFTGGL